MTLIQYMMMVMDVHDDYGYNNMIKKPQETTDTSAHPIPLYSGSILFNVPGVY